MGTFHVVFQTITNVALLVGLVYVIAFIRRVEHERHHRYRSPVAAIKGLADVGVLDGDEDGDAARRLRAISSLAQDALDVAIEPGQRPETRA